MKVYLILILFFTMIFLSPVNLSSQVTQKPVSIILIIANGMGIQQITAAMIANGDTLNLEKFDHAGFMKTYSKAGLNIDLQNGTVPIATGMRSINENLPDSIIKKQKTILEIARAKGKETGFVTTGNVTGNSIAPFYSHKPFDKNSDHIIYDLIYSDIGVFIGGGRRLFREPGGINFIDSLEMHDYKIIEDYKRLKKGTSQKIAGLVDKTEVKSADKRGNYLELAWQRSFKWLVKNKKGYFLIIENPHIEWAARQNDWRYMTSEIIDFDKMIGQIVNYVSPDNKTLVIVLCPYEIGGMAITDGSLPDKHINTRWVSKNTTAVLVPVFATGPGSELFNGIYDNTDVFLKLKLLLE